ncbi:MAG: HAD hydrolase family protein [Bacteroides sp.]|nr:HAD hydrolase family protein [Bacteroides sp.]MCM1378847.1 HAD hydrolase family protein [Bacteroides sp.]MCM1445464.1 HAD hydrolase family protein [Prevotella sp.]
MIPYDLTKVRGFAFDVDGVLSPNLVPIDANGAPARMANVKDGYALHLAAKLGYKLAIITGADTEAVYRRYSILGIKDIYLSAGEKLPIFENWMADNGLRAEEVAYCGDDVPDLLCLRHAGLSIAPADASPDAKEAAKYVTSLRGGHGVARELIEQTLRAQGRWPNDDAAYGW